MIKKKLNKGNKRKKNSQRTRERQKYRGGYFKQISFIRLQGDGEKEKKIKIK